MLIGTWKTVAGAAVLTGTLLLSGAGVFAYQEDARRRDREQPRPSREVPREEAPRRPDLVERRLEPRDNFAGRIVDLANRARALQAEGRMDEARRRLTEIRDLVGAWEDKLARPVVEDRVLEERVIGPQVERRLLTPGGDVVVERTNANERRLDELERKLDRVLEALERRQPAPARAPVALPDVIRDDLRPSRPREARVPRNLERSREEFREVRDPVPAEKPREAVSPLKPSEDAPKPPKPPVPPKPPRAPDAPEAPDAPDAPEKPGTALAVEDPGTPAEPEAPASADVPAVGR